jgi:hypothetical protein
MPGEKEDDGAMGRGLGIKLIERLHHMGAGGLFVDQDPDLTVR